jgi:hypothetical protein
MSEFVTDKDLRNWDILKYGSKIPSENPNKPKKIIKELQNRKIYRAHKEEKEKPRIYNEESATIAAVAIVTIRLQIDLGSSSTASERAKKIRGYAAFAQLIRLMLGSKFDLVRIHKAIAYENKPSMEVLKLIFDDWENQPFRYDQLKAILNKDRK